MQEQSAVVLKVSAGDGLAPGAVRFEGGGPEDDVLAVKGAVTLANGHSGLPRVIPDSGEPIRFRIEAGDAGAGALAAVSIKEREIGLQEFAILDHVLLACGFRDDRFAVRREERLDDIPLARELR